MGRQSFGLSLFLVVLHAVVPRLGQAAECSVQRRDYSFNTYFELSESGQPSGTILRQRWRQPWRSTYELYDAGGDRVASATTRLFNLGAIFSWARTLDIVDEQSLPQYVLRGVWFTVDTAVFELKTKDGTLVSQLRVDLKHSGCIASRPNERHALLARFYRNQISDHNHERWDYVTLNDSTVPAYVWQLIAAFFADVW